MLKEVYLHAMVRDKYGGKMSKSKGNVIDPLFVKEGATLETMLTTLKSGLLPEKELKRALDSTKKEYPKGIPACGADAPGQWLHAAALRRQPRRDVLGAAGRRHDRACRSCPGDTPRACCRTAHRPQAPAT